VPDFNHRDRDFFARFPDRMPPRICQTRGVSNLWDSALVLDNAERESYAYIHRTLDGAGWRKRTFDGPGPYVLGFWTTCAWQKPR
jgi:hypothetical protein